VLPLKSGRCWTHTRFFHYPLFLLLLTWLFIYSIDQRLQPGIRCTVQLDTAAYGRPGPIHGKVVSPSTVTQTDGTYWGYTVRMASSIKAVFDECPYADKYDLTIGTSERGSESIDDPKFSLLRKSNNRSNSGGSTYRHALIVFGGIAGIEECIDADESLPLSGSASSTMFDRWINVCPYQGSRTIRSEEAVLITLARLSPFLATAASKVQSDVSSKVNTAENPVKLNNEELSEESSDSDDSTSEGSAEDD
jgi:predicted SPOUT superfamily RNA methylase MTH1